MLKRASLAVLIAAIVGASASADAADQPSQVGASGPGLHGEPGGIGVLGGSTNNQITVRNPAPSTIVVTDTAGAIAVPGCPSAWNPGGGGCGCQSVDPRTVGCDNPYGTDIGAALADGDDAIRVFDPMVLRASGDSGADRLTGDARDDYLRGNHGQDRLSGREGNDRLFTDAGHDIAYGGAGNDLLWVLDEDRDRLIDCGGGNDRAYIDRKLDPDPVHCELVRSGRRDG